MSKLNINSTIRMNSGYNIPILGYGVYKTRVSECEKVTSHAFKTGYRHIDSAVAYGNEREVGAAINSSGLPRSSIFFTTKISPKGLSYDSAKTQIVESLKATGLSYIDLILIHSPHGGSANRKGAWKALVEAQEEGKVRSLGVSNYGVHHLDELETHIQELEKERGGAGKGGMISVGQYELHPWCERQDIVDWCKRRNIVLEAYCPMVRGERADESILKPLTEKYGKTFAQVLLRWSVQKGFVPLPKSVTPSRIEENAAIFDFELTEEEVEGLSTGKNEPTAWDPTTSSL